KSPTTLMCSTTAKWFIQGPPTISPPTRRACGRLPAPAPRNGHRERSDATPAGPRRSKNPAWISARAGMSVFERLAGAFRIEAVFRAHLGDDCEVLAAGNKAHHRTGDMTARDIGLDDIGLRAVIGGVWALGINDAAVIHRILGHDSGKLCPFVSCR